MTKARQIGRKPVAVAGKQESLFDETAAPAGGPIRRTLKEVAKHFKIKQRQMANWKADGMPVEEDGTYDLIKIDTWARQQAKGPHRKNKPKDKKAASPSPAPLSPTSSADAPPLYGNIEPDPNWTIDEWTCEWKKFQALLKEIELKKEVGELLPADQVRGEWNRKIVTAKNRFLGISRKLSPRLYGLEVPEIERIITEEIRDIIGDLADGSDAESPTNKQERE